MQTQQELGLVTDEHSGLSRRSLFKKSAAAMGLLAIGTGIYEGGSLVPAWASGQSGPTATPNTPRAAALNIIQTNVRMYSGAIVPHWSYQDPINPLARAVPGPWLVATQGEIVSLTIKNNTTSAHGWWIPGVTGATTGSLAAGASKTITFTAPAAGTYLYGDPVLEPIGRLLGLQGVLTVMPATGITPYSTPSPAIQTLFSDLSSPQYHNGYPWDRTRQWVWLFNQVDPVLHTAIIVNKKVYTAATFQAAFKPRYFTINGLSGFDSAHSPDVEINGFEGEPALIRMVNGGLANHSPHIHGNHCYTLARNGVIQSNLQWRDAWHLAGGERIDVLLPYTMPPDVERWPPLSDAHFPMMYPMHCHMEMSQTSNGGDYPNGAVTHWLLEGPKR